MVGSQALVCIARTIINSVLDYMGMHIGTKIPREQPDGDENSLHSSFPQLTGIYYTAIENSRNRNY